MKRARRTKRDARQLYYLILKSCSEEGGRSGTHIQADVEVPYLEVRKHAPTLIKLGLLTKTMREHGIHPVPVYHTTAKGRRLVSIYSKILDCLKGLAV